ncbi:MAG: hypothetical protein AAF750_05670 [Planctomycetota bacterium]
MLNKRTQWFGGATRWVLATGLAMGLLGGPAGSVWAESVAKVDGSAFPPIVGEDQPIMPLSEVRIGMRGYGLTVFAGTAIEAFPVEVRAIVPTSTPGRATVWVDCLDPRMQKSGPVQGMSGSPIYLWDAGEAGEVGKGGRLIGAFAFGYANTNECVAGVQPIEYMRETGGRADADRSAEAAAAGSRIPAGRLVELLRRAERRMPTAAGVVGSGRYRLTAVRRAIEAKAGAGEGVAALRDASRRPAVLAGRDAVLDGSVWGGGVGIPTEVGTPNGGAGGAQRMMLPMLVGSEGLAAMLGPALEPMGIVPVGGAGGGVGGGVGVGARGAVNGLVAGEPAPSIDRETKLEPGSMVSIPLAFGDMDLSAAGTVTDVRPDGTVLAFGHAMYGSGPVALPMASSYVHFIASLRTISFKNSGSIRLLGSLVQDEAFAVAGTREKVWRSMPMSVTVEQPGVEPTTYRYEVVEHPELTPLIVAALASMSFDAVQTMPAMQTLHAELTMVFTDGQTLEVAMPVLNMGDGQLFGALVPFIVTPLMNPVATLKLASADVRLRSEPVFRFGTLTGVTLDRPTAEPGQTVGLTATVKPAEGPERAVRLEVPIPEDMGAGQVSVLVGGANLYTQFALMGKPYLMNISDGGDVLELLETVGNMPATRLSGMVLPNGGGDGGGGSGVSVAVGRTEMPGLPGSRLAVLGGASTTGVLPVLTPEWASAETGLMIDGVLELPLEIVVPGEEE